MTVQYNPFTEAPIFLATENHDFIIPFYSKGNILGVSTRNPIDKELQTCPHINCLSANEWDPQNVCVPKSSHTAEEEISMNIGAGMTEGGSPDLTNINSDSDSVYQTFDISATTSRMIGSVKVALMPSMNVYEKKATMKILPQAKTFQSKGRHSTV